MSLSELTSAINAAAGNIQGQGPIGDDERQALLAAMEKLRFAVETPFDALVRAINGAYDLVSLKLGVDLRLFDQLAAAQGEAKPASEFAKASGADSSLVNRIFRLLATSNFAKEVGEQMYAATPISAAFSDASPLAHSVKHLYLGAEVSYRLPEYLRSTGYKEPTDAAHGPFQFARNTKLHYFDWLKDQPEDQTAFNIHMALAHSSLGPEWFSFYPGIEHLLQESPDASRPFLVDVGGNTGHSLNSFATKYPDLTGRLVLEDLPQVIEGIGMQGVKLDPRIEPVKYDFFTPQPVKHAKVYYMRTILHDWPDKQAIEILKNIREAMAEDSVLLIHDLVMPDTGAPTLSTRADWVIMAFLASLDRTAKQYRTLLNHAGFEMRGPWKPDTPGASCALFEAAKKS